MNRNLAINGGSPLTRYHEWPRWPVLNQNCIKSIEKVLYSGRWAISGPYNGYVTFDELFCKAFANYNNSKYAITVDHGSTSIILALQALGISYGDEVIVSGLTWVACASAILRVNAKPVFVDIEKDTLCLDAQKVEEAITCKTRAILIVHLYSCMANMDQLKEISRKYSIPLIEDCSQSHGAIWNDRKAGSIGDIGVFSMQQGKPLTCGEGGAIVTNDEYLFERITLLKNDGRALTNNNIIGRQQLVEQKGVIGSNYALSEFQCAILWENLKVFEEILATQRKNAEFLSSALQEIPGINLLKPHPQNTSQTYYHFILLYDKVEFSNVSLYNICEALSQELGTWIHPIYQPLYSHTLFQVQDDYRYNYLNLDDYNNIKLQECEKQACRGIALHHSLLLSEVGLLEKIVKAFKKVQKYSFELI